MEIYSILRVHILGLFLESNNMAECDRISYIIKHTHTHTHTHIYIYIYIYIYIHETMYVEKQ